MIAASGRFDLPFTCVDSSGVPTAPTGTPTGTLVKNGTDLGTTVTVTMSTAQGIASCTIPSDAAVGDRFYIRISAVISGTTYSLPGPAETIGVHQTGDSFARIGSAGAGLTSIGDTRLANLDAAISSRLSTVGYTAPPSAATNATAVRSELTTELARIDVATSTRLASASYSAAPSASTVASQVRTELTTELGRIDATVSSRLSTVGYTAAPSASDNATAVWAAGTRTLTSSGSGSVEVSSFDDAALDQLRGIEFIGPQAVYGEAKQIVAGDDYSGSRAIVFASDAIPDLSAATSITFTARTTERGHAVAIETDSVVYTTGQLAVTLTAAETRVDPGFYDYDIEAVVGGLKQTVIGPKARLVVLEDQTQ